MDMNDFKIIEDTDIQTINLDLDLGTSNNDSLGIELLADPKKTAKTDGNADIAPSPKREEFNLFNDNDIKDLKIDNNPIIDFDKEQNDMNNIKSIGFKDTTIPNDPILSNENKPNNNDEFKPIHTLSPQDIKNEKIDLIYKFKRLENQGVRTTMNYNMNSSLDDMRNEYVKLKKQREAENSIKFQRKMLMACITGVEFLNGKFDPFAIKLDGWSESMNEGINDYDEIFEELHEKYGGRADVAPEIKLMLMVGGSAFMFHLTNTMFKTSLPGMDDILKQNPELMQQFAKAAVNTPKSQPDGGMPTGGMGGMGGMGGLMSGLMGGMMGGGNPMAAMSGNMPTGPKMPPKRSEMKGSNDIDDIINNMNIDVDNIDLDNISIISGDSGNGITLNI
tara:strand:+ start:1302 stop:2474 length:1173 start_codon:yes stop_codon:yes gene_type:complete